MRVLFLGAPDSRILKYLGESRSDVRVLGPSEDLDDTALVQWAERIVSHGYRRILSPQVLEAAPGRFINCHISLLPWNRGADPNLWSVLEGTPRGVSIHALNAGIDTGDVLAQRRVELDQRDTLASSYEHLQSALVDLFRERWSTFVIDDLVGDRQPDGGNLHRSRDRVSVAHLRTAGWDTPVSSLIGRLPAHTGTAHGD